MENKENRKVLFHADLAKIISIKTGLKQKDIKLMLEALYETLRFAMFNGYEVFFRNVGTFKPKHFQGRPAGMYYNIVEKGKVFFEAGKNYIAPEFKFTKPFKTELRDRTLGYDEEQEEEKDDAPWRRS